MQPVNSYMNITVRVLSANAQAQVKALQAQVAGLQKQLATANATASAGGAIGSSRSRKSLAAWGNQLQWTGRQIQYNFTLPLVLAGAAATKFALDNERAFTRVSKVYGDTAAAIAWYKKNQDEIPEGMTAAEAAAASFKNELGALQGAFEALSSHYGVQQKEVIETAAAWAAAGASGVALAKSTQLSLQAAVLGEMDLAKATEALIAVQAQYGLTVGGLNKALAEFNAIENQTGISMQGLIDGFARSAGVAREAGVDVRHLGAMLAALVPATGSAATAGNSLKTIISRLMSPTGEAADVMREFGVNTADAAWQSSTAIERLTILAGHMGDTLVKTGKGTQTLADDTYELSDSQKQVVASVLGSRYQMNRFLVLMREMGPAMSYYEKALDSTSDTKAVFAQKTKELNEVLKSSPKRLEILWYTLQNGMADAIQPMIPYILYMVAAITKAVTAFSNLDPEAQKFFFILALGLASVGLFMRYLGSTATLLFYLGRGFTIATLGALGLFTKQMQIGRGSAVVTTSIWGMTAALIAMPFRAVSAALGAFLGLLYKIPIVARGLTVAAAGFRLIGVAIATGIGMAFRAATLGSIIAMMNNIVMAVGGMVATWSAGLFAMVTRWTAAWAVMGSGGALVNFGRSIALAFGAMFAGMSYWLGQMMVRFIAFDVAMTGRYYIMRSRIIAIWGAMHAALLSVMTSFRILAGGVWTGLYILMNQAAVVGGRALVAIQAAMYRVLLALQTAWSTASAALSRAWVIVTGAIMTAGYRVQATLSAAFYRVSLVMQRAWHFVSVNLQMAWTTAMWALTSAYHASMAALQRAWATIMFNIHLAWTVAMLGLQLKFTKLMAAAQKVLMAVMTGPWGIAIAAIVIVLVAFRKQIATIWGNIVAYFSDSSNAVVQGIISAWNALPQGVANALTAVAKIVQQAAMQIYEWFSYINPFARHSPSLVDNVRNGLGEVRKEFQGLGAVGAHVKGAYADIKKFGDATAGLIKNANQLDLAQDRKTVSKFAPGALDEFSALSKRLGQLQGDLKKVEPHLVKQQQVVDTWAAAVDKLNHALDNQQYKLDQLTRKQQKYQDLVDEAAERLDYYQSVGIRGERAMSDAIFENEMAQKALRLEMMRMEEVGGSLDEIRGKIESINGAQEVLRGTQESLRAKGAGSEILGHYQDEIDLLEQQKQAYNNAAQPLQNMQDQLDALQRKGEEMDLLNSLKFDPLRRQIEQAGEALKELPFDQIMRGTNAAREDMERYQRKLDDATNAVDRQQEIVDRLTHARDKLQHRLDQEQYKLDQIQKKYDSVNGAIGEVEGSLDLATQSADKMSSALDKVAKSGSKAADAAKLGKAGVGAGAGALSPAVQNFRDAMGGNFADVGGDGIPMRMDWGDQSKQIEDFTNDLAKDTAGVFADLNPFTWIKKKWGDFKSWWSGVWAELKAIGADFLGAMFAGVGSGGGGLDFGAVKDKVAAFINGFKGIWTATRDFIESALNAAKKVWDFFWPDIKKSAEAIGEALVNVWEKVGPEFSKLWKEIKEAGPALKGLFNIIKVALTVSLAPFVLVLKVLFNMFSKMIGPAIEYIGDLLAALMRIFRGVFQFFSGFFALFTGDIEGGFKKMWAGLLNIVGGLWDMIWASFKGGFKFILGGLWGFLESIWKGLVWLYDEVVGHSIIPDLIDGIIWWFGKLWNIVKFVWSKFIQPLVQAFVWVFKKVIALAKIWFAGLMIAWAVLKTVAVWFWENVLKPIWTRFKEVWEKYIWPAVKLWWEGLKIAWGKMKDAAIWLWDNVLKPVWDNFKAVWDDYIWPAVKAWWEGLKIAWKKLKAAAAWLWKNVLKPIWDKFKEVWDKYIWPATKAWWEGLKIAWKKLKAAATWIWDNVLKPVWDKFKEVWAKVGPELKKWWERIKQAWNTLKQAGIWIWQNVLKPVWDKVKQVWVDVKSSLSQWWEGIKKVWDKLKGLGQWVWENVMKPVIDKIKEAWNDIKGWLNDNKDMLLGPMKDIVNGIIGAINTVIKGLNKVADVLPGVDWEINLIEKFAAGGVPTRKANRGMRTSGARAIVGEGKANHPEFVIPTDPTYRQRAIGLMRMAAIKLGLGGPGGDMGDVKRIANSPQALDGIPAFGLGGWLDDKWDDVEDMGNKLVDEIAKLGKNAVGKIMDPILNTAHGAISSMGWTPAESPPLFAVGKLRSWVTDTDKDLNGFVNDAGKSVQGTKQSQAALKYALGMVGTPYDLGGFGPGGIDCSGFMSAIANVYRGKSPYSWHGTTHSFPWTGWKSGAKPAGFTVGSIYPYPGSEFGHMAGTLAGVNVESSSGAGVEVGKSALGYNHSAFNEVAHLAQGAIVRRTRYGTLARIGEGSNDEAVTPLPSGWKSSPLFNTKGGDNKETHLHFHGDLSFPNIKSGDDAEKLIENLKNLSKD